MEEVNWTSFLRSVEFTIIAIFCEEQKRLTKNTQKKQI